MNTLKTNKGPILSSLSVKAFLSIVLHIVGVAKSGAIASLLLWVALISFSAALHAKDSGDLVLEHELDKFITLYPERMDEARELLVNVEKGLLPETATRTKVRLYSYQILFLSEDYTSEEIENLLTKTRELVEETEDNNAWAETVATHLQYYSRVGDYQKALEHLELLTSLSEQATDPRIRYIAWSTVADFQAWQGKLDLALYAYHQAYNSIDGGTDPRNIYRKIHLQSSIAQLHATMRNYPLAFKTIEQALTIARSEPSLSDHVINLYTQQGMLYAEVGELNNALESYQYALVQAISKSDLYSQALINNNIGDTYLRKRMPDKAISAFELSLSQSNKEDAPGLHALLNFNIGYAHVLSEKTDLGLSMMTENLEPLKQLSSKTDFLAYLLEYADAHNVAGAHKQEASILREYNRLSSEIFQSEREKQINQLQEEFAVKEKAKQIQALTQANRLQEYELERKVQQQNITWLIILVVFMATVLVFVLYHKVHDANVKLKEANSKLADQSIRDPLTGLLNRRSLHEYMQLKQGERRASVNAPMDGFVLLDIDFFKRINDDFGHAAGDAVLIAMAERLTKLVRGEDMVLRWGGEEFLLMIRGLDINDLMRFTERVLHAISDTPFIYNDKSIQVTASAGVINYPFSALSDQQLDWQKTLQLADNALYLSKVHGRNRAYGLSKLHKPYHDIAQELESDFSHAVESGVVEVIMVEGVKHASKTQESSH